MRNSSNLDRSKVRHYLESIELRSLFVELLGWDHGGEDIEIAAGGRKFILEALAHKRGMVAYRFDAARYEVFPDHPTRQKIEKAVAKNVREHLIVFITHDGTTQYWQWVKREPGRSDCCRVHIYDRNQPGEALIQKLEHLVFTLNEEEELTIVDVSGRVRAAFDVESVTKKFYDRFRKEHRTFLDYVKGIKDSFDKAWYTSLMLNRLMFVYFIQKRGFLDGDIDYLRNRHAKLQQNQIENAPGSFYRMFLLPLFHEGLSRPVNERTPEVTQILGKVPYLNGGLFEEHELECEKYVIHISDVAFEAIFNFFDAYQWHLDDRPLYSDNEINPDVLGYIFEKYINQKQMGAYYTKEDITRYISRNTIVPFLFDQARKECPIAFQPDGGVWRLLSDNPDRYIFDSVRHGITYDLRDRIKLDAKRELPPKITLGLYNATQQEQWDDEAPGEYALPSETWREHINRRKHYENLHKKLKDSDISSINDLITYNLDVEKFALDVITTS